MASLGVIWLVPSFEKGSMRVQTDTRGRTESVWRVEKGEIDFLKPQARIDAVEVGFEWLADE